MSGISERSFTPIDLPDLERLACIAAEERADFFARNSGWAIYTNRIICVALCQGAALHFVNGKNGIKDFDVWTFYAAHSQGPFPYRRVGNRDFGASEFGRRASDEGYIGRRVDLIGRSIPYPPGVNPVEAFRHYLSRGTTKSARLLAQKAVVLLEPNAWRGIVVWP